MRIGHLVDGGQGFWVSFDPRGPTGYHTRYWDENNEPCNFTQLQGKVKVDKELELSNFTARKKTTANKPQILKQKLLIRKIYLQEGVLYEGNVEEIEAVQAEKDRLQGSRRKKAKLKSGITKNTTPKKPKIIEQNSKSIFDMFKDDACNLPTSPHTLKKLRASWKKLILVSMATSSRPVLHEYTMKDQSTANALGRRSMRIGKLMDSGQNFWVSYDKREKGDYPKYWNDDGKAMSSTALKGKIEYAKGLELSHFSAMKKTKANVPQNEKRKQLINKIYRQEGRLYEGDYAEIEAAQAAKHASSTGTRKKAGKATSKTTKVTKTPEDDSSSLLEKLYTDASSLPATEECVKRLQTAIWERTPKAVLPTTVLLQALGEAHATGKRNATSCIAYMRWQISRAESSAVPPEDGEDESSEEDEEEEEVEDDEEEDDDEDTEGYLAADEDNEETEGNEGDE